MRNIPRKHHYIPECYLKQFANSQKQLWKRKKNEQKVSPCTTAQICYEFDAFKLKTKETLDFNDVGDENYIEKYSFRKQENNYGKNISKIITYNNSTRIIEKNTYKLFLETLVTIKRKNPLTRNIIINAIKKNIDNGSYKDELLKGMPSDSQLNFDWVSYLDQHIQKNRNDDNKLYDMYLSTFINYDEQSIITSLATQLFQYKQIVLHPEKGNQFITSDNPGVIINNDVSRSIGGLGEDFKFIFPLSPFACLLIDSSSPEKSQIIGKIIYHFVVDSSVVNRINGLTKLHSNIRIFSLSKDVLRMFQF